MNNSASLCNLPKSPIRVLTSRPSLQRRSFLNHGVIRRPLKQTISMQHNSNGGPHLPNLLPSLPNSPFLHFVSTTVVAVIKNVKHTLEDVVNVLDKTEKILNPSEILTEAEEGIAEKAEEIVDEIKSHLPKNGIIEEIKEDIQKGEKAAAGLVESIAEKLHLDPKHNQHSEDTKPAANANLDLLGKAAEEASKVEKAIQGLNPFKNH